MSILVYAFKNNDFSILAGADVPNANCVVKAAGEHKLPGGVERDGDHFRGMALHAP